MPDFKLKYEDSENIKTYCVDTVVFNLHVIKRRNFFETPGTLESGSFLEQWSTMVSNGPLSGFKNINNGQQWSFVRF